LPLFLVLLLWFITAVFLELADVDEIDMPWWIGGILIAGIPLLSLIAALSFARVNDRLASAMLYGGLLGGLAAVMAVLGSFLPYAAYMGSREPHEFAYDDTELAPRLATMLVWFGLLGASFGWVSGLLARGLSIVAKRQRRGTTTQPR
jgi:hypothetical protein